MSNGVVHVTALVLLVIGVSEAFFLAEMFGPSAELEAACPGSCQVRRIFAKKPGLVEEQAKIHIL